MLVGLSLSFCIQDIIHNKVAETDVLCIIAGTNGENDNQWAEIVGEYVETYWWEDRSRAIGVIDRLKKTGRIIQPRVLGQEVPNIAAGWWVDLAKDSTKERR